MRSQVHEGGSKGSGVWPSRGCLRFSIFWDSAILGTWALNETDEILNLN